MSLTHEANAAPGRPPPIPIPAAIGSYLANSYPNNHDYRVVHGKLAPGCKLSARLRKLRPLYPPNMTSLLDLSCCKGYFVLQAALQPQCQRALGIDIHEPDLEACAAVRDHLGAQKARFHKLQLHELAGQIDDFGGPFQTVLLINMYQYLFFGSSRSPDSYMSHDAILQHVRRVCSGRVIFNNRMEADRLQDYCRGVARARGLEQEYTLSRFLDAAANYFRVTPFGRIGRYPLLALDVK